MAATLIGDEEAESAARDIAERHIGRAPQRVERQRKSLSNLVYIARYGDGDDVVVRFSPDSERGASYRRERWAGALAVAAGVPVPEVLAVGDGPFPFMVQRLAAGREASDHPERMRILREVGALAARINAIRLPRWGSIDGGVGGHASWNDYLDGELEAEARLATLARLGGVSPERLERLRTSLATAADGLPGPALTHGDLRLKNVLVDRRGAITALIDWEHCTGNLAPAWELSVALHDLAIDAKHAFLAGYGLDEHAVIAAAPAMKALNLLNYAPELERLAEAGDEAALRQVRLRLAGMLDLFSL